MYLWPWRPALGQSGPHPSAVIEIFGAIATAGGKGAL